MTHLGNRAGSRSNMTDASGPGSIEGAVFVPLFQGETRISDRPEEVMTTILGSCIATCMWDPVAGVGGMNHFLLPGDTGDRGTNMRYGVNAMELLVNGLLKKGADRTRLNVKIFGGAKMFEGGAEIGAKNASFAEWYLSNEGFKITGAALVDPAGARSGSGRRPVGSNDASCRTSAIRSSHRPSETSPKTHHRRAISSCSRPLPT